MEVDDIILWSDNASLKFVAGGSGSIIAPYATSIAQNTVTIPHGMGSSQNIFWSVDAINTTYGLVTRAPWSSPDGRVAIDAFLDETNLYIRATSQTAGAPQDPSTFNYSYKIIVI